MRRITSSSEPGPYNLAARVWISLKEIAARLNFATPIQRPPTHATNPTELSAYMYASNQQLMKLCF